MRRFDLRCVLIGSSATFAFACSEGSPGDVPGSGGGQSMPGAGAVNGSGASGPGAGGSTGGTGGATADGSGGSAGGSMQALPCEAPPAGMNPSRVCIKGKQYYLNGINVAWDQWTNDLVNYDADTFEAMFAELEGAGASAIRWWWFIDGENQLSFDGQTVQPLDTKIFDNLDLAFDAAAKHGILIMPSLLSFDIEGPDREFLLESEAATDAFVDNVVKPLVERSNDHAAMGLWEIMNEGDWLLSEEGGKVSVADYQRFHGKVAAAIHAADADALVTTGSASFKYLA